VTQPIEGGCLCGAVRYRLSAPPTESTICHCTSCRRATGAPAVGWITCAIDKVEFTRGSLCEYRSSAPVLRGFCAACGTPLTWKHQNARGTLDLTTASLDDPRAFPPTEHLWVSEGVSWARFADGLRKYPRSRREGNPAG
jgi:hypothetical protein